MWKTSRPSSSTTSRPAGQYSSDLAELALLLGDLGLALLQRRDVVDPEDPLAADEADMAAVIGDLDIGNEDVERAAPSFVFQTASWFRS